MRRKQPCPCRGRPGAFPVKEPPGWNGMEKRKRGAAAASAEGKRKPGPWKRCRQKEAADEKKRNRKRIKKRQDLRNKVFLIENNSARILVCREAPATPCIRMLPGHPVWVLPMGVDSPRRKAVPDRCQGAFLLRRNHRKRRRLPNLSRNPAAGGAEASQYQEVSLYRKGKRQGETCQNAPHQTGQRGKRHPFGPKLQPNWKNSLPGSP